MKYFYKDLELDVPNSVYEPKEDSELLASVIEKQDLKEKRTLEIGCGSGLLSIIMAKADCAVTAVDVNPKAVETAKANAEKNHVTLNVFRSDLFEKIKDKFDLIIFNPPYLPVGEDDPDDITYSGGATGREIIEKFVAYLRPHLNAGGKVLIVISSLTGELETMELFHAAGLRPKAIARQKLSWEELIVIRAEL